MSEQKAEGIIVLGAFHKEYENFLFDSIKLPLLFLDTEAQGKNCDAVVSDNLYGGCRMTDYLFEMGHRKIAFVGTLLATPSIDDRYLGYVKSMLQHGVETRPEWIIEDRDRKIGILDNDRKMQLPSENMPTAFFCNNDLTANRIIQKLEKSGYHVPEDISVAGFDNYLPDASGSTALTTYEIDTKAMAGKAFHILIHKIENQGYTSGIFMMRGKFIERQSVKRIGNPVPFA